MPKKGFTLIELLVVVAIIAILAVIGFVVLGNVTSRARDARRKADIDTITKAYEVNYDPGTGKYQALADNQFTAGKIPNPPESPTGSYICVKGPTTDCTTNSTTEFLVCANLEGGANCTATADKCYCKSAAQGSLTTTAGTGGPAGTGGTGSPASKPLSCENFGDLDKNKVLSESDSEILVKYDAGLLTPTADERMIADVDYDGSKSFGPTDNDYLADATHLTQYISNKISQINVCSNAKSPPCTGIGDVSTDGKVTQLDAVEALRVFTGGFNSLYTGQPYTNDQKTRADVDNNGTVNSTDSLMIKQYLAGTRTTFPACSQ